MFGSPVHYMCFSVLQVRSIISDFAVFLTIVTMVGIDFALGIPSPKLQVPNVFKVSHALIHTLQR